MTAGDRAGPAGEERARGCGAASGTDGSVITIIVDGANVVGSRPDGWWRDRAGAAVRLHDELARLAARGATGIPAKLLSTADGDQPPDLGGDPSGLVKVRVILVLEGAARAAAPRIAERARTAEGGHAGEAVQVVTAPGSGDDEIVRLAQSCAGHRIVVTADRELRRRCLAAGAQVAGPSWLYALL